MDNCRFTNQSLSTWGEKELIVLTIDAALSERQALFVDRSLRLEYKTISTRISRIYFLVTLSRTYHNTGGGSRGKVHDPPPTNRPCFPRPFTTSCGRPGAPRIQCDERSSRTHLNQNTNEDQKSWCDWVRLGCALCALDLRAWLPAQGQGVVQLFRKGPDESSFVGDLHSGAVMAVVSDILDSEPRGTSTLWPKWS